MCLENRVAQSMGCELSIKARKKSLKDFDARTCSAGSIMLCVLEKDCVLDQVWPRRQHSVCFSAQSRGGLRCVRGGGLAVGYITLDLSTLLE